MLFNNYLLPRRWVIKALSRVAKPLPFYWMTDAKSFPVCARTETNVAWIVNGLCDDFDATGTSIPEQAADACDAADDIAEDNRDALELEINKITARTKDGDGNTDSTVVWAPSHSAFLAKQNKERKFFTVRSKVGKLGPQHLLDEYTHQKQGQPIFQRHAKCYLTFKDPVSALTT